MKKILILLFSILISFNSSAGEVETHTLKLKALNSCESCNLQGAILSEAYLTGANLNGANLSGAKLYYS